MLVLNNFANSLFCKVGLSFLPGPKLIFSTSWGWGGVKGDVENYRTCCGLMRRKGYCITKTDSCGCCRPLLWGAEGDEA